MAARPSTDPTLDTRYEAALEATFEDIAQSRVTADECRRQWEAEEARVTSLVDLAEHLIERLPEGRRPLYRQRLRNRPQTSAATAKGGPTFSNVINLFSRSTRQEWTASEIQDELASQGIVSNQKAISNILNYLLRAGKLQRVARGQYVVREAGGVVISEEIDGAEYGQTRLTEHDV
jgi:hypothetical protein